MYEDYQSCIECCLCFLFHYSFEVVQFVYDKLLDMKGNIGSIPVVLVGNKCDLTFERYGSNNLQVSFLKFVKKYFSNLLICSTNIIFKPRPAEIVQTLDYSYKLLH